MARPLRVKRLDSPLARNGVVAMEPVEEEEKPAAADIDTPPAHDGAFRQVPHEPDRGRVDSPLGTVQRLRPPPPLEEPLEFVSGRVPASLAQRLNAMTLALRQRQATRASQKVALAGSPGAQSCSRTLSRNTFSAVRWPLRRDADTGSVNTCTR